MEKLSLRKNRLRGGIPDALCVAKKVRWLWMEINELSGRIPEGVSCLKCYQLFIHFNRLSGTIPDAIGSMTQLEQLSISSNQLSGKLPDSMGSMTDLGLIGIFINRVSGTIPVAATCSPRLAFFMAYDNRLSGHVRPHKRHKSSISGRHLSSFGGVFPVDGWSFFSSWSVLIFKRTRPKSGESGKHSCGENDTKSCRVSSCHGLFGAEQAVWFYTILSHVTRELSEDARHQRQPPDWQLGKFKGFWSADLSGRGTRVDVTCLQALY